MARPTKLTPAVQKKIVDAIKAGNYMETAAAYAGISKQTLYNWMRKGARAEKGKHRAFLDAVEKALAEAEIEDVLTIGAAAKEVWQAAAWRLERKFPDRWGRRDKLSVSVLDSPEWHALSNVLLDVLSRYPEAAKEAKKALDEYIAQHGGSPTELSGAD